MTASLSIRVIRSSLADWRSMKKECRHARHTRNGIPSCFLFRGMVRNEISRVLLQFCSTVYNSKRFSLPRNGFGTEFRDFCIPQNSRNSVGINQFFRLFRLPRNNFFVGNCQPYCGVSSPSSNLPFLEPPLWCQFTFF